MFLPLMIATLIGKSLKGCSEFLLVKVGRPDSHYFHFFSKLLHFFFFMLFLFGFELNEVWVWIGAVTAVDSGRRALQFLGLDEEKNSNCFDVSSISKLL